MANKATSIVMPSDIPKLLMKRQSSSQPTHMRPMKSALKRKFRKIVEGVGSLKWGVEGNLASAEEQMGLVQFVKDKRNQKIKSYTRLFTASVKLLSACHHAGEQGI